MRTGWPPASDARSWPDDPLHHRGHPVGVSDSLLRLSIGLEDCDELIADLGQALDG